MHPERMQEMLWPRMDALTLRSAHNPWVRGVQETSRSEVGTRLPSATTNDKRIVNQYPYHESAPAMSQQGKCTKHRERH